MALGVYAAVYWIGESDFPGPLLGGVAVLIVLAMQGFILALVGEYRERPLRAACPTSTSTTLAPPASTRALVNFCRPIAPSIGSIAVRR